MKNHNKRIIDKLMLLPFATKTNDNLELNISNDDFNLDYSDGYLIEEHEVAEYLNWGNLLNDMVQMEEGSDQYEKSLQELKNATPNFLFFVLDEVELYYSKFKTLKQTIEKSLSVKYNEKANEKLYDENKKTGTVTFRDGEYLITAEIPKKVVWDQEKMKNILATIPLEECHKLVKINYSVDERSYQNQWDEKLQDKFNEARKVEIGKLKVKSVKKCSD